MTKPQAHVRNQPVHDGCLPMTWNCTHSLSRSIRAALLPTIFLLIGVQQPAIAQRPAAAVSNTCKDSYSGAAPPNHRFVSWDRLAPNIICDQKKIWTFPARLKHSRALIPVAAVVAGTVGLALLDRSDAPYFRGARSWQSFDQGFSGRNTALATVLAPVSLYGLGLIGPNSYDQKTALLAGEAAVDAEIVSFVLKDATHRLRPRAIPPNGNFGDTWYDRPNWTGASGFPSGHTITAFAIATVIAHRYASHRWVRYVAYGAAALIGFSRVTSSAHFPSSVFFGAALGYRIGRVTVLR
ncbi:MAG: phosphatase PAP2 family protein [Candidatus Acidiferrales bacterium]